MNKRLVALPFLALALIAAKPVPVKIEPPVSMAAPAEVAADPANRWTLELSNGGKVVIQLRPDVAPQHVYRIQQLTVAGFYDGLLFHRVIPGFMAQGGDPLGTGEGGSKLPDVPHEFSSFPHVRGVASMARAESLDSANSQFFIMLAPRFVLDRKYSAFGRVIEGMAAVDGIAVGEPPAAPTKIVRATIGGPLPAPPVVVAAAPAPATPTDSGAPAQPAAAQSGPPAAPADTAPAGPEQSPPVPLPEQAAPAPLPAEPAPAEPEAEIPPQEAPTPQ
jgi:cyclophilin family peptidyl-prolyl cis-trans isomerase